MSTTTPTAAGRATLADLGRTPGKAELIAGRIVHLMPTGLRPNLVAGRIYRSLADHTDATGQGLALTDNMGFAVPELPSGRQSFSPDAAYFAGPFSTDDMRFLQGPPTFAVEVRSENDYGPTAEVEMAAKRADYFQAGTVVVWDVDPVAECVHAYRADAPDRPITFVRGQDVDAEPAVPGWRITADRIFP
jgi:Uma2 family endonuclease